MEKTAKNKIYFILSYNKDFDIHYLLEDCLNMLTDEQLNKLFERYQDEYEEALQCYKEDEDYFNF